MNDKIMAYAMPTGYDCKALKGFRLDHVCLCDDRGKYNWNCFGRGRSNIHDKAVRTLCVATGNAEWLAEVYGRDAEGKGGRGDQAPAAAGVYELFNGVCQNAANRLLALTDEDYDVSKACGNELVVLAYGKYGFGIEDFIQRVKKSAEKVNARHSDCISQDKLERAVACLKKGQTVSYEFEALTDELPQLRAAFEEKTTEQGRKEFAAEYAAFQERRSNEFAKLDRGSLPDHDAREQMGLFLKRELSSFLMKISKWLGPEVYGQVLAVLPQEAFGMLAKLN